MVDERVVKLCPLKNSEIMGEYLMQIHELLFQHQESEKTVIIQAGRSLSYAELCIRVENSAAGLRNCIDESVASVAIFIPNSIAYAIGYFSIAKNNKTIVPISISSTPTEVFATLNYCGAECVVTDLENVDKLIAMLEADAARSFYRIFNVETLEIVDVGEYTKAVDSLSQNELDGVAVLLHTSGTTSNPKRVMLTHDNLIANIISNIESLKLTAEERSLIVLPMHFGYCNTAQFLTHIYLGATLLIYEGTFFAKKFLSIIEKEKITNTTVVPTMLLVMLQYRGKTNYDLSSLKTLCFGGGFMPVDKLRELIEGYPSVGFVQTYGQTECSPRVTALLPEDSMRKVGSVGKPISGVAVKIVDEDGVEIENGDVGELLVYGSNVMKGYFRRREETDRSLLNGWHRTGDLGRIDKEGYIYLVGRKKNVIISGGINIYPEEIEELLRSHDCVAEAFVFGAVHELLDEEVVAHVVLNEWGKTNQESLKEYCFRNLSNYKIPAKIYIVDKLEKTYNGKVRRNYV